MNRFPAGALAALALSSCVKDASAPQPAPAAQEPVAVEATKVRTMEGIDEYALPNGLRVLLFPDPTQSTVTVASTVFVGSLHEGYGETGMAHLLEHMAFKGTPTHRNILALIDARGGWANGTTWTDRTNYFETLPATGDNLEWALAMEADRLVNCTIAQEDLSTEFSVVRNEFEMGENDPAAILEERVMSTAYLWHNYGNTTIGARSDIENVPIANLRRFYERNYRPDNAMLVVAGRFEAEPTIAAIERLFGPIPRGAGPLEPPYTVEPVQDGEREVTLRRTGDVHQLHLAYHTVGGAHPDYPAVEALTEIIARKPTGRVYQEIVEGGLASSLSSWVHLFREPTLINVSATVPDGARLDKVERTLVEEVEALATADITPEEVERFKARALKNHALLLADSERTAVELSEWAALGDWRLLFTHRHRVESLTDADVERVAKDWLLPSNRTLGRFLPTTDPVRARLPEPADVAALVAATPDRGGPAPGEPFPATIDNIEAHVLRKDLAGGVEAVLLPKKTRGETVSVRLTLRSGDAKGLASTQAVAPLTAALSARGTTERDYQHLVDEIDRLRARIGVDASPGVVRVGITTDRAHLAGAVDLAMEMLWKPSFPAEQLEIVRREALTRLEEQRQDPSRIATIALNQTLTPWPAEDPRATLSIDQQRALYQRATVADLKAYHRGFVGTGAGELVAIGDFDPDALTAQIEGHLKAARVAKPYQRPEGRYFGEKGVATAIDLRDKEMAQIVVGHQLALRDDHPDYPALLLAVRILGGDTASRLWMRLREKEGLSYGTWSWAYADARDEVGGFGASAIVAPSNLDKAKAGIQEEIARLVTSGVTEGELAAAKQAWVQGEDTALANDGVLADTLGGAAFLDRTLAWDADFRAKMAAVTPAEVAKAAATWLDPEALVVVEAGDLVKAGRAAGARP